MKQGAIPAFLGADREKRRVMMSCLDVLWSFGTNSEEVETDIAFSKVVISLSLVCPISMDLGFVRISAVCGSVGLLEACFSRPSRVVSGHCHPLPMCGTSPTTQR